MYLLAMNNAEDPATERSPYDAAAALLGDVAEAANIPPLVLKAWLDRKVIPLSEYDQPAIGKGSARIFTFRRVLSIAIMAELTRLGITPSRAAAIGYFVTDTKGYFGTGLLVIYGGQDASIDEKSVRLFTGKVGSLRVNKILENVPSATIVSLTRVYLSAMDVLVERGRKMSAAVDDASAS